MSLRVDASLLKDGDGQLGVGSNKLGLHSATTIPSSTNVVQVSAGGSYSLVLFDDGTVKSFGFNLQG